MKITSFSVKNFRSIEKTNELPFHDISILIGPNNEGKSNILKALVRTLKILSNIPKHSLKYNAKDKIISIRKQFLNSTEKIAYNFDWEKDFPLNLQKIDSSEDTEFTISLFLSKKELGLLRKHLKGFTGNLMVTLTFKKDSLPSIKIKDPVAKKLFDFDATLMITSFLSRRFSVQYIDAIRTTNTATRVVSDLISNEMSLLEEKREYIRLLKRLEDLRKPVFEKLSKSLTESVSGFLPNVKEIFVNEKDAVTKVIRESSRIIVHDKAKTDLESKGDGIKSLVAISIIQYAINQNSSNKNIILAIEEPESHLHPEAIHRLKEVLDKISTKNQVIITTHSPILASRANVKKNLIVNNSKVVAAKNISEVRKLLGVHVSDNLVSASLVILTEGENDVSILKTILIQQSRKIKEALNKGVIVFDHLVGSSNLKYKVSQYKSLLCDIYAFLDNDDAGRKGYDEAKKSNLISEKEISFASVRSYKNSEIEDLIKSSLYKELISKEFGVQLEGKLFKNNKNKWSDRVKNTFQSQGKPWDVFVEERVKKIVADKVEKKRISVLEKGSFLCIKPMITYIENYLKSNLSSK